MRMGYMKRLRVRKNVALAPLSTFKIGGRARFLVEADCADDVIAGIQWAEEEALPWRVMAGGSNIVFPDKGLDGLLIRISGGRIKAEGYKLIVDAGVALADVVKESISLGLEGLETLSGIPGTIGGAVYGNAGAYGHSISECVEKIEILVPVAKITPRHGSGQARNERESSFERKWISKEECGFGYRESVFKRGLTRTSHGKTQTIYPIILQVVLGLNPPVGGGGKKELEKKSREIIQMREKKYRPGVRCPGSFFKNVLVKDVSKKSLALVDFSKIIDGKIPAGWLLEQVGAKGMEVGGILIADFHGNLFINSGRGKAADVKKLAVILKRQVFEKFGIELEEEVRYF